VPVPLHNQATTRGGVLLIISAFHRHYEGGRARYLSLEALVVHSGECLRRQVTRLCERAVEEV